MYKISNVVWIILVQNILCSIIIATQFLFSYEHFKIVLKNVLIDNHFKSKMRNFGYCGIGGNHLVFLQDASA